MAASKNVLSFDEQNFQDQVLQATEPVLVDFTAAWCGPCRMLAPILEQLADEYAGKLKVGKVDIDSNPALAAQYGIRSIPTVMVFQGGEKRAQHTGLVPREKLIELTGL